MGEGPRQIFRYQIQVGDIEETERGESGLKIMCTGESYKMSYRVRAMESGRGRCIFAQTREVERERERENFQFGSKDRHTGQRVRVYLQFISQDMQKERESVVV